MARLLSVNVGLPRDVAWNGRTVHTGVWKNPVAGACRVNRLHLEGDGQGDLAGHGGEHRAVFVYQIESYRYWQERLKRTEFRYGQFGENFTIEGLADDEVCIGDRYQVGSALFEVTQPRVTCFRVGIRMNEPRMAALLTSSGRPGFYFRVLREGAVTAGDEIVKVGEASDKMTVAQINALLYLPGHTRELLERALRIEALSRGWRGSFEALLQQKQEGAASGNAGLAPQAGPPAAPGFSSLSVNSIVRESADVVSFHLQAKDGRELPPFLPGQYVVLRLQPAAGKPTMFRCYSLSGPLSKDRYRISVKREPGGAAGTYLQERLRAGDRIEVSSPRGSFVLQAAERPIVLLSAGIGATPVLAMLHALANEGSPRRILWLHAARDGRHHTFASEARGLVRGLAHGQSHIRFTQPEPGDKPGEDFDAQGRFTLAVFRELGLPLDSDVYLCGPERYMVDMKEALTKYGLPPERIFTENFGGGESLTPGIAAAPAKAPHPPDGESNTGPLVSFARSSVTAHWDAARYASILELAEACDVPVRWACRTGVCHSCESGLISGEAAYNPEPLDKPASGNILICCSQPASDVVVDL